MSPINRLSAVKKLIISLFAGVACYGLLMLYPQRILLHFLASWDTFCACFLALNWITFFTIAPREIRKEARSQDEGRIVVFIIALVATLAAFMAVVLLVLNRKAGGEAAILSLVIAFAGMILSWALVHTVFAGRYAHIYYADHEEDKSRHAGGLDFPGDQLPDFLDFAYFSFVLGMTFQVSDVAISARRLRRLALLHSLMAFAFNTVIVALTINVIAGLSD
ncbi:DUF1345 domain-containing protein [Taibaiella koreensis]|uniref:DUF1345 domain-containing protein n=1 Tax=Taibaiella koreensis TaxID=1268548 RepID=UPI000E5A07ED|nr:DUF1345 domain-containing protein [Taibaiella koreensis]